jgi:hypothetical protein
MVGALRGRIVRLVVPVVAALALVAGFGAQAAWASASAVCGTADRATV